MTESESANVPRSQEAPAPQPTFRFARFVVVRSEMEELPLVAAADDQASPPAPAQTDLEVGARVTVSEHLGVLALELTVRPDPRVKPYQVHLVAVGEFVMTAGTREQFIAFLQNNAPVILFPYVRQRVESLTADGRYGGVRLDPLNLQPLLNRNAWSEEPALTASEANQ